ncbi:DUF1800 domain-containing protein [Chondromyces crocatus]|uniref:DUF1800 domain-containing protein n=1 Tax=Chondromyces crocatus TaxID=52 RepID=A0A0K1EQA0_CHOCO|nr:DUF1800 domain-containing protein [Chondromyces crocatus]AKT43026.1 uncharacterized protein CMC5_072530 [Chondromyces crocatus]
MKGSNWACTLLVAAVCVPIVAGSPACSADGDGAGGSGIGASGSASTGIPDAGGDGDGGDGDSPSYRPITGCIGGSDDGEGTPSLGMSLADEKADELLALPAGTALGADGLPTNMPARSAVRFLNQATFGATDDDVARLSELWRGAWIHQQFELPIGITTWDRVRALQTAWFNSQNNPQTADPISLPYQVLDAAVWASFMTSPDQLRKRVSYALSQILVVSMEGLGGNGYQNALLAAGYLDVLERNAFGNFRDLLKDISLNPAMGMYLSHKGNKKAVYDADGVTVLVQPDENYAREVMQLFSIGLLELNSDGAHKLDASGAELETYTTEDVMGLSRVFTGWDWEFDSRDGSGTLTGAPGGTSIDGPPRGVNAVFCECYRNPMVMTASRHAPEEKEFLGVTIPAGTDGVTSLEIAIDTLFNHPNVGPFLARQLIQRLVTSNPSAAYVKRVADKFADNGNGERGDMKALIEQILRDPEARSPLNITSPAACWGKVREPVVRLTGLARLLGLNRSGLVWSSLVAMNMSDPATQLSQSPLRSQSVFNFYRPGYVPPNSAISAADLVGPEFQITTETAIPGVINYLQGFMNGGAPRTTGAVSIDMTPWLGLAAQAHPGGLVADLNLKLANDSLSADSVSAIEEALGNQAAVGTSAQRTRVRTALLMILSSPEYLIQK